MCFSYCTNYVLQKSHDFYPGHIKPKQLYVENYPVGVMGICTFLTVLIMCCRRIMSVLSRSYYTLPDHISRTNAIFRYQHLYPPCSGRLRRMKRSTRASSLTKGPRKQFGGGNSDRRLATAGGGGKAPPGMRQRVR